MNLNEQIKKLVEEQEQYIIDCRHKLHAIPEVCSKEVKTKAFLMEEIKKSGLPYEEVPTNSIIVKLDTGRPGKVVALRADIDGLPVKESEENLAGPGPVNRSMTATATPAAMTLIWPCCWGR